VHQERKLYFDWVDALKAFAILGILLNHLVEEFGPAPWFANPSNDWPDLATRLGNLWPQGDNLPVRIVYFLGWLGDSGPGIFILLSGFGLTLSMLKKPTSDRNLEVFYQRRLIRIFPLYLTIHLLTILGAFLLLGADRITLGINTLLSFLGLRFRDSLFMYINPSWWFIWLLIQLYFLYPFLFRLMKKAGLVWFFLITLAFTILSRGAGLAGIRYSNELFFWMTGIFFGARLAEFTLGMALAALVVENGRAIASITRSPWFLPISFLAYVLGLSASVLWIGALISNLLVTAGFCGLFYSAWRRGIKDRLRFLTKPIIWIGMNSFGVFLLHQAPLIWTGELFGDSKIHLIAALLVVALSFPLAMALERSIRKATDYVVNVRIARSTIWSTVPVVFLLLGLLVVMTPARFSPDAVYFLSMLIIAFVLYLIVLEFKIPVNENQWFHLICLSAIFASSLKIFILPSGFGFLSVAAGCSIAGGIVFFYYLLRQRALAWALALPALGVLAMLVEMSFRIYKPLETPVRWGEFPALQVHPTRAYGLKPNLDILLKYNNYRYRLQTNSEGLASPEIAVQRPSQNTLRVLIAGDAFSMPEGMGYQSAYPHLLEERLSVALSPTPVQVINGGVTGYGPNESLPQIAELVPVYRPDIVIYQFFINEWEEVNLSREERLINIGLISGRSRMEELIFGSQLLAYGKKYERQLREFMKGKDSSYRYQKSLLRFYQKDNALYKNENTLRKLNDVLSAMKNTCREYHAKFLIVFVPGQAVVSAPKDVVYFPRKADLADTLVYDLKLPLKKTAALAAELAIPLTDLTPALKNHPAQPVYFPASWHWNQEGHRVAAEVIFEALRGYEPLSQTEKDSQNQ
jgi:peptidoglycan/LPS O-acetylase OafA/YrhL